VRLRFAPSPTGQLHVGNARTALFNWLLARGSGGTFILRIEDTDAERSTAASAHAILEDLRWMGLTWDEGVEAGGDYGPYRQTERLHIYRAHAVELISKGHAYRCFCSAQQLEADRQAAMAEGRPPKYVGRCRSIEREEARRRLESGEAAVVRLRVPSGREVAFTDVVRGRVAFHTDVIGDPVLVRSDGFPAYNYAVVIDDALMKISHVIRGEDHISNTPRQVLLYEAFGWTPPIFAHVSLVMGPDHSPLSKRHGATSVAEFRARGYLPEALTNYLALIGWSPGEGQELLAVEELARRFRLEDVGHAAGVFDPDKLAWANRHYLKAAAPGRLAKLAVPYLQQQGWLSDPTEADLAFLAGVVPVAAASVDRLEQVPARLGFLFDYSAERALGHAEIRAEAGEARLVLGALASELAGGERMLDREAFRAMAALVRERTGVKGKALFHPIRLALTGEPEGLELDVAVPAIERGAMLPGSSSIRRIKGAAERAAEFARLAAAR
jgi:glutamyl-tRNA synthetase/nondiscriminating glutamyl-tRNA synthetase